MNCRNSLLIKWLVFFALFFFGLFCFMKDKGYCEEVRDIQLRNL